MNEPKMELWVILMILKIKIELKDLDIKQYVVSGKDQIRSI